MAFQKPKGTNDIYGFEAYKWQKIEQILREISSKFCAMEIRTPMFEYTEVFKRGVGETTDVVQKEMFTFKDRGNREYSLKPEGTAGTARAYLENKLYADTQPTKLFYITPAFRDERNQAGRFKQFHQFGLEVFGSYDASCDAEVISFVYEFLNKIGVKNVEIRINSLGGNQCRKNYNDLLKSYIGEKVHTLCDDCKSRFENNPLRVLDCKNLKCKDTLSDAPVVLQNLDEDCKKHFEDLKEYLKNMEIPYVVDSKIVRGLDYYTRTVFEFVCTSDVLGSQTTICGGGRYDNLIKQCGGSETGAVGFAIGIERILILMEEQGISFMDDINVDLYIGSIGDNGFKYAQKLGFQLRQLGISVEYDIVKRSVKSQLKYSDKINSKFVIIIGDEELKTDNINLKIMEKSIQEPIKLSNIKDEILNRL